MASITNIKTDITTLNDYQLRELFIVTQGERL